MKSIQASITVRRAPYMGKDSTAILYTIKPNTNTIYVNNDDTLSQEYISFTVIRHSSEGVEILADSTDLARYNLHMEYSYDEGERIPINKKINTLELEDNTPLALENGSDLYLSFTVEDIKNVKSNIILYLINKEDKIETSFAIPVYGNGREMSIQCTPSSLSYNISPETNEIIDDTIMKEVLIEVRSGGEVVELDSVDLTIYDSNNDAMAYTQLNATQCKIELLVTKGSLVEDLPKYFHISAVSNNNSMRRASYQLPINYMQRGMVGPKANDGPMLFPAGYYKSTTRYTLVYERDLNTGEPILGEDGKPIILARPFVYNKEDDTYYVLQKNIDGNCEGLGDGRYWKEFTKIQYLFTEALMADWASLASAIFHGDYMFSQDGVGKDGTAGDYSEYMGDEGSKGNMFDKNGRLTEDFTPNLFLNYKTGAASLRKFSELFENFYLSDSVDENGYMNFNYIHRMDMNRSHNVSVFPRTVLDEDGRVEICGAVVLPPYGTDSDQWSEDGTHATIAYQIEPYRAVMFSNYRPTDGTFVAVCSDARWFNNVALDDEEDNKIENCFIWKGFPCKWILLSHGQSLKLRSIKQQEQYSEWNEDTQKYELKNKVVGINWIVENAADFDVISLVVRIQEDGEEIKKRNYSLPDSSSWETIYALGGGFLENGKSVYDGKSIFIDLGTGVEYSAGVHTGGGPAYRVVKVGLTDRISQ